MHARQASARAGAARSLLLCLPQDTLHLSTTMRRRQRPRGGACGGGAHVGSQYHGRRAHGGNGRTWSWGACGVGGSVLGAAASLIYGKRNDIYLTNDNINHSRREKQSDRCSDMAGQQPMSESHTWMRLYYYSTFADICCRDESWVYQHAPSMIDGALQIYELSNGLGQERILDAGQDETSEWGVGEVGKRCIGAVREGISSVADIISDMHVVVPCKVGEGVMGLVSDSCNNRDGLRGDKRGCCGEGGRDDRKVDVAWVDAPKSRGLALVCVAPEDKIAVIVVRGTVNVPNFVKALKMWPRYLPDIGVGLHAGFAEVAEELLSQIEGLVSQDTRIHLTGHSMGGAVSIILAMRLIAKGYHVSQVVAFGSPMVVWNAESERFQKDWALRLPLTVVENPLDPVINFPVPRSVVSRVSKHKFMSPITDKMYQPVGRLVTVGSTASVQLTGPSLKDMHVAHRLWKYREHLAHLSLELS